MFPALAESVIGRFEAAEVGGCLSPSKGLCHPGLPRPLLSSPAAVSSNTFETKGEDLLCQRLKILRASLQTRILPCCPLQSLHAPEFPLTAALLRILAGVPY